MDSLSTLIINETLECFSLLPHHLFTCYLTQANFVLSNNEPHHHLFPDLGWSFTSVLYQPFLHFCENEPHHHLFTCHLTQADLSSVRMNHTTICLIVTRVRVIWSSVRVNHTTICLLVTWVRVVWSSVRVNNTTICLLVTWVRVVWSSVRVNHTTIYLLLESG